MFTEHKSDGERQERIWPDWYLWVPLIYSDFDLWRPRDGARYVVLPQPKE